MPSLEDRLKMDTYREGAFVVLTEKAHLERGSCCGSNCRHCPYEPRAQKGGRTPKPQFSHVLRSTPV